MLKRVAQKGHHEQLMSAGTVIFPGLCNVRWFMGPPDAMGSLWVRWLADPEGMAGRVSLSVWVNDVGGNVRWTMDDG